MKTSFPQDERIFCDSLSVLLNVLPKQQQSVFKKENPLVLRHVHFALGVHNTDTIFHCALCNIKT